MSNTSPITGDSESSSSLPSPTTSISARLLKIPPIPRTDEQDEDDEQQEEDEEDDDEPNGFGSPSSKVSPFGLNYIRTRSIPSPLRFSSSAESTSLDHDGFERSNSRKKIDQSSPLLSLEEGRKVHWINSNSGKNHSTANPALEGNYSAYAKEIQSPRFQAILRVTSGRKKRAGDVKSFSHELNSKGVRPFPLWRPRALGHAEEILAAIRAKFDKLKEEVDDDLGAFGSDLVGIIQCHGVSPAMKQGIEDLLVVARRCVKMEADEFWVKCEGVVQELDDKRQDLPPGLVKQAHTRMLFILTRCTRLVQFQKETGYDDDRILGLHQLSDLGVYPDQLLEALHRDIARDNGPAPKGEASGGSYRMASWRKLPSPAAKSCNRRRSEVSAAKPEEEVKPLPEKTVKDHRDNNLDLDHHHRDHRVDDHDDHDRHHQEHQRLMICRICEVEIPTAHAEEHSRICTLADRCDLKGLTVDQRLARVAETLEKLVESSSSSSGGGAERVSTEEESPSPPRRSSEEMIDCGGGCGPEMSSGGSVTPRSPLMTPRTGHVELLVSRHRTTTELENHDHILKLMEVARAVANVSTCDYSALQYMVERLELLKYVIQDRKVDALVIETFGRCIEKLIQEKYVHLSGQIEDEKVDPLSCMVDEESSVDEDPARSVRTSPLPNSPINACPRDRTTIEDFEIIKPISRGAFGRVFLAKKRSTGDLFAIKVLKKADMIRKNAVESILAERNILITLRNPFVVRFYYSFTCRENLYLVMEYLNGGDLYSLLRNLGCLDEDMARIYIAEVVLALEYLHSLNVIHRDLKPDNLLIGQDGHIKLTDFGLSKVGLINSTDDLSAPSVSGPGFLGEEGAKTPRSSKREARQKQAVVGTPDYLAPEILLGMGHAFTADWWSVGVILFELLVGIPPFNADHPQKIFDNIINRDIPWPRTPEEMSFEAYDIIDKLLTENPVQRLGATGAGEVKKHPFFKDINWDTLARQKAMFIPTIEEAHDTSYFMSRFIWNPEDDHVNNGGSDFDDMTETCSTASYSYSNVQSEDGDECGSLAEFTSPAPAVRYSFSNFSFKNLSQLASINYDLVVKSLMESSDKPPVP